MSKLGIILVSNLGLLRDLKREGFNYFETLGFYLIVIYLVYLNLSWFSFGSYHVAFSPLISVTSMK